LPLPDLILTPANPANSASKKLKSSRQQFKNCNRNRHGESTIVGPVSPDTVFHRAIEGEFDAVLCMYHDQGLIPLKLHAFHSGVNVTLGLPFPRTSPDHGTAFEIAGKGIARPDSMIAAINLAVELASRSHQRIEAISTRSTKAFATGFLDFARDDEKLLPEHDDKQDIKYASVLTSDSRILSCIAGIISCARCSG
jgi:hypothetical protein